MNDYSASTAYRIVLFEEMYVYLVCSDESMGDISRRLEKISGSGVKLGVGRITSDVGKSAFLMRKPEGSCAGNSMRSSVSRDRS